jgi:hypothetical protein
VLFGCAPNGRQCDATSGTCVVCVAPTPAPTPVPPIETDCKANVDCGGTGRGRCFGGVCRCEPGFAGKLCEIEVCDDVVHCNAARGGGQCVDGACQCNLGFALPSCAKFEGCNAFPCANGGLCVVSVNNELNCRSLTHYIFKRDWMCVIVRQVSPAHNVNR